MKPPLATLRHIQGAVVIQERGRSPATPDGALEIAMRFTTQWEARSFLSFWLRDAGAMSQLRQALQQSGVAGEVAQASDEQVLDAFSNLLISREVEVLPRRERAKFRDVRSAFGKVTSAATAAATQAAPVNIVQAEPPSLPPPPPALPLPPLLPILEDIQVESAEVLPEIDQTLEQIDETMSILEQIAAAVGATPNDIPAVATKMADASSEITEELGEL